MDNFIEAYSSGLTPNPCVVCNSTIKFGELHRRLAALGDQEGGHRPLRQAGGDPLTAERCCFAQSTASRIELTCFTGSPSASLSQYLSTLETGPSHGCQTSPRFGLDSADRPDSQEVCFTAGAGREFLLSERPWLGKKGPIVDLHGRTVGEHQGLAMYTIGQRHSLGRLLGYEGQAMYVVAIRPATNTIVVGPREAVYSKEMVVADLNWICYSEPPAIIRADVKVRYTTDPAPPP